MAYEIAFRSKARRQFLALSEEARRQLAPVIDTLAVEPRPRPPLGRKLTGDPARYRLRVGDYRVIYRVDDHAQVVEVTWAGHRRDAYRD